MKQIRKRLTYANVMSSLAVFLVLGGGAAVAARSSLPAKSVGPRQLQPRAVKTGKIGFEAVKAGKLAKGSVPTDRLRDGAVTAAKIFNGSILTAKLRNNAVSTEKIRGVAVTAPKIAPAAVDTGKLADEAVSNPKLGDAAVRAEKLGPIAIRTDTEEIPAASPGVAEVSCGDGERLLGGGGGFDVAPTEPNLHLVSSMNVDADTWRVRAYNDTAAAEDLTVRAICLDN